MNIHESAEDYLERILMIKQEKGNVRSIDIANDMNFSRASVSHAIKLLKENKTVHFYPEASLWPYYKKLRKFKNGAFKLAVENNVPIVPMVYKFVKPYGIRKYIKKKPFIELYVLPAIYPDQNLDKKQATEKLKNDVYLKMKQELES